MWNERYATDEYLYGTEPNDFLASVAGQLKPASRILCLAEGEGRNAVHLAGLGHAVVGVDAAEEGIKKARRLAEARGVALEAVVADLADYAIPTGSFDAIVSIFCHLPPPLRRDLHARVVQGLGSGGLFILEAYTPTQLELKTGGPPVAELMMTAEGLKGELAGLELERVEELQREISEGRLHHGPSAVVQLLGRKP